jgi:hypothetical protein
MSALTEFLFPAPARRTVGSILGWWEQRRLVYNVAVGCAGLVSLGAAYVQATLLGFQPPPLLAAVAFGVAANLCYFFGPAVEIAIDKLFGRSVLPTGPALYRMGLTFSVGLALLPTLVIVPITVIATLLRIFG